ncbi:MAG: hypothetical protein WC121_08700 [Candidatus Kapaibacterium sp.]
MKYNNLIKTVLFIIGIVILTSCSVYDKATDLLTPVDNPMEYQNVYFPINVGIIKTYNVYSIEEGELQFKNKTEREVIDFRDSDVRIGSREFNLPVFRLKTRIFEADSLVSEDEEYLIKTKEGIAISNYLTKKHSVKFFELIPSSSKYVSVRDGFCYGEVLFNVKFAPYLKDGDYMQIKYAMKINFSTITTNYYFSKENGLIAIIEDDDGEITEVKLLAEIDFNE